MDENKNFEEKAEETIEEIKETAEEVVGEIEEFAENAEEAAEEFAENAEEAAEEFVENAEDVAEEIADKAEDAVEEAAELEQEVFEAPKKKKRIGAVVIIAVAVLAVVLCALTVRGKFPKIYNKYNHMGYVNITGRTIADIAAENGMELSELLEQYGLPADMPGNTQESAAYYSMPVKTVAQMYGMSFEDIKELLGMGEDITEDTPWGVAEGEVTIEKYIGADNLDSFKEEYGFGDEVTLETKWKEVRNTVDNKSKQNYEEQNAAKEEQTDETAAETEETDEAAAEETEESESAE